MPALPCLTLQAPNIETGFRFREEVYRMMGAPVPAKPPPKVLLYLRQARWAVTACTRHACAALVQPRFSPYASP